MALFADIPWGGWPQHGSVPSQFLEGNPNAAYQRLLEQLGFGAFTSGPQARYAQGLNSEAYQTYLGALSAVPNPDTYDYTSFLDDWWKPRLATGWASQTASQRGERFPGGVGRARWIGWAS